MTSKLPHSLDRMAYRALTCTLVALPLTLLISCGGGGGASVASGPATVTQESAVLAAEAVRVSITSFESTEPCIELKDYLATYADTTMRRQLSALRDSPNPIGPMPVPADNLATTSTTSTSGTGAQAQTVGSPSFTTTNVQTSGMDEMDSVKNDASHIYRLQYTSNGTSRLHKARYQPAQALTSEGHADVPSHPVSNGPIAHVRGMFLTEDQKVAVLSSHEGSVYALMGDTMVATTMAVPSVCAPPVCGAGPSIQTSYVDIFNAAGPGAPVLQAGLEVGGRLIDARRRGNKLWLVTQQAFNFPSAVQWWPTGLGYDANPTVRAGAIDQLIAANTAVIRATPLRDWLPADLARALDGTPAAANQACRAIAKVSEPTELGWLKVATVDLADRSVAQQTILAQGQMVYASPRAIYVTTPNWRNATEVDPGPRTYLHKFSIAASGAVSYTASGAFAGQPLNSYSLDEDEQGVLRFAANAQFTSTNTSNPALLNWAPFTYLGRIEQKLDRLSVTSRSLPIAPGERMQSARFVGGRAYLVTFLQVDPFYVFDMNAVGGPKQLGELKIPGFSTYLHPVGDHHILGIGYQDGNWPRRIKASLFDVSDPTNPREQSALTLGDFYSASEALWNPHAFSYLPRSANTGVLAIPVWSYRYQNALSESSSIKLLNVSASAGLSSAGELSVNDVIDSKPSGLDPYALILKRSILTTEHVIGVGDRVLRSATLAQPGQSLSTLLTPW